MNSFGSSPTTTAFPSPTAPSLLSNDSTNPSTSTDLWANGLSNVNNPIDYNEYAKQLGFFMNAFTEQQQQQQQETEKSKTKNSTPSSSSTKHSKNKHSHTSASPDVTNGKKHDDSRRSSSSSRSKSSTNPPPSSSSTTKPSTTNDPSMLDPMAFAAAAAAAAASGGLTFPYFLPSLLSQTPSTAGTNNNPSTYPFSSLTSSLANPTAGLYPFLSPDWFTSPAALGNLTPGTKKNFVMFLLIVRVFFQIRNNQKNVRNQFEH